MVQFIDIWDFSKTFFALGRVVCRNKCVANPLFLSVTHRKKNVTPVLKHMLFIISHHWFLLYAKWLTHKSCTLQLLFVVIWYVTGWEAIVLWALLRWRNVLYKCTPYITYIKSWQNRTFCNCNCCGLLLPCIIFLTFILHSGSWRCLV